MPCWNPPRWSLGASALIAVVVAGCGASSTPQKPSLHAIAEKRLLSLVAHARADATKHDGTAVHAALGEFVSEVRTLKSSGQLTGSTAGTLDRAARRTATQAARQLRPAKATAPASSTPDPAAQPPAVTTSAADSPTTSTPATTPAAGTTPTTPASSTPQIATTPSSTDGSTDKGDGGSARTGHGHGYGHRYSGDSAWRTAVRGWINSASGAGSND